MKMKENYDFGADFGVSPVKRFGAKSGGLLDFTQF